MMEGFSSVQVDSLSVVKCNGTAPLMIAGDSIRWLVQMLQS